MSHNFSLSFNVGPNHFSFAFNSVSKNSCLQFYVFMIAGRYTDNEIIYKIVSEYEADVSKGMISIISPLAKALIGKKVDESLEFNTPKGIRYYKILSVDYI